MASCFSTPSLLPPQEKKCSFKKVATNSTPRPPNPKKKRQTGHFIEKNGLSFPGPDFSRHLQPPAVLLPVDSLDFLLIGIPYEPRMWNLFAVFGIDFTNFTTKSCLKKNKRGHVVSGYFLETVDLVCSILGSGFSVNTIGLGNVYPTKSKLYNFLANFHQNSQLVLTFTLVMVNGCSNFQDVKLVSSTLALLQSVPPCK